MLLFAFDLSAQLSADFNANKTSGCSPLIVNFTDLSSGGTVTNWTWDFGNGNTSTGSDPSVNQNPSAIYNNPGTYTVTLTVSGGGSSDVETKQSFITVFNDPQADFNASSVKGCYPFDVSFTDVSVNGSGSINQWFWDFGDGNVSISQTPTNTYISNNLFTVSLVVTDDNGCQNTIQKTDHIEVVIPPLAIFAGSPLLACDPPLNVNFTNSSTASSSMTYEWDFGDGNNSTQTTPTNNYSSVGTYDVSLIVTDALGCADTNFQASYIGIQKMNADFDFTISGCAPASISFSDSSAPGPNDWLWDFGGGGSPATSTSQNPTGIIFSNPGTYAVELIATNAAGCADTISKDITIDPAPVADFTANITSGCILPMDVSFTENSINASSFFWSFGDGSTSTQQNPTHTYTNPGTYNVILTVFNSNNCSDTKVRASYIEIVLPQANFQVDTNRGCVPLDVNFTDLSTSGDPIVIWEWDFGDSGTSTSQTPGIHTYSTADSFTVSLIIENSSGCRDTMLVDPMVIAGNKPSAAFTAQPLSTCADSSVTFTDQTDFSNEWLWDFGDGSTSSEQSPTHIYTDTGTFNISLIAYHNGCPDTLQKDSFVRINPPIAKFFAQQSCASPSLVNFINQSEGGDVYKWKFGDGDSSSLENPSHNYSDTGRYTVSLNVVDTLSGCEYTSYRYVDIIALGGSITADTLSGCAPLTVSFNSGSQDAISWAWDFGDGQTSSQDTPKITYSNPGIYTIELIITDLNGCKDTIRNTNYIQASGPVVDFSANQTTGCAAMNVNFTDLTSSPSGFVSWKWSFGDGDTSILQNPSNVYPDVSGSTSYSVSLEVLDTMGCTGFTEKLSYINQQKPSASFLPIPNPVEICPGDVVTFINASSGSGLTYLWDFGDGNSSTASNASNTYDSSGLYSVTLIVTDNNTCKDTMTLTDVVESGLPYINFGANPKQSNCAPLLVSFTDSSANDVVSWQWDFGDNTSSTLQNPSHLYTAPGDFDITLIVEDVKGCWDTLYKPNFIEIDGPYGTFTLSPDSGCAPMEVGFFASAINTKNYTWDFGDGILGSGDTVTHTYLAGKYFPILVLDDSLGCLFTVDPPDSIVVSLIPYTITPDTFICPGDDVPLNATGGLIYSWGPDSLLNDTSISNPVGSPLVTSEFYLSIEDAVGCQVRDTVLVTIDTVIATAPAQSGFCPNDSVQLQASGGLYYNWSPASGLSSTTIADPYASPGVPTTYNVIVSDDYCSDTAEVEVIKYNNPIIEAGVDQNICYGSISQLEALGGEQYTWSPNNGLSNIDSNITFITADSSRNYYVTGTDTNGCSAIDSVFITVFDLPVGIAGPDTSICFGVTTQLSASGGVSYKWSPFNGLSDTSGASVIASPDSTTIYSITITDQNGCTDTVDVDLTVYQLPDVDLGEDFELLLGQTVELGVSDGITYIWSPSDYLNSTNSSTVITTPLKTITYTVEVTDENSCINQDEITITVYSEARMAIPKAFTPNGDGKNDVLYYYTKGMAKTSLKIFNRWGQMVFESTASNVGWDGKLNGIDLEMDTYTYYLTGTTLVNEEIKQKGNISLIR